MLLTSEWKRRYPDPFLSLAVGIPFGENATHLLLGGEDGVVRMYCGKDGEARTLETKGGAVTGLLLYDIMRFGPNDVVVGDSQGHVSIFARSQLLSRAKLSGAVTALAIHEDAAGNASVVAGDNCGSVTSLLPYDVQWRVRMTDDSLLPQLGLPARPYITCVASAMLTDADGVLSSYVVVADSSQFLHFLSDNTRVMSLFIPQPVNAMCCGRFVASLTDAIDQDTPVPHGHERGQDIAVVGDDGVVYVVSNFEVLRFAEVGYAGRHMCTVPQPDGVDLLVCAGRFNGVTVFRDGEPIARHPTGDWVQSMAYGEVDNDGVAKLVLGMADGSVEVLRLVADTTVTAKGDHIGMDG